MSEIADLREALNRVLLARTLPDLATPDAETAQRLITARQALAPPRGHFASPRIAQGTLAFRLQRQHTPYPDLKYACYGIARPTDWSGRQLLEEANACDDLLAAVEALATRRPQAFAACCRGLRQAWTRDIAPAPEKLGATARQNAARIAAFLRRYPQVGAEGKRS